MPAHIRKHIKIIARRPIVSSSLRDALTSKDFEVCMLAWVLLLDHLTFKPGASVAGKFVCRLSFCVAVTVAQLLANILWVIFNWAGIAVSTAPPLCFLMHWKQSSNESSLSSPSAIGNQIKASSEKPVPLHKRYSQIKQSFPSLCSDSSMTKVHLWFFPMGQ